MSQDLTLRQTIRKSVKEQPRLLDSIGTAEMESEAQKQVLRIVKKTSVQMAEQEGIEPSMSEDYVKNYLELVIKELRRTKK